MPCYVRGFIHVIPAGRIQSYGCPYTVGSVSLFLRHGHCHFIKNLINTLIYIPVLARPWLSHSLFIIIAMLSDIHNNALLYQSMMYIVIVIYAFVQMFDFIPRYGLDVVAA